MAWKDKEENIKALFIFEMLGRPPEHIKETLGEFINKLGEQPGIEITSRKIHEPHPVEKEEQEKKEIKQDLKNQKELFSTFAEVELSADNINLIFMVVFHMLPSNVVITEPAEIRLKNFDLSSLISELAIKLHKYDEVAKALVLERNNLMGRIRELEGQIKKE